MGLHYTNQLFKDLGVKTYLSYSKQVAGLATNNTPRSFQDFSLALGPQFQLDKEGEILFHISGNCSWLKVKNGFFASSNNSVEKAYGGETGIRMGTEFFDTFFISIGYDFSYQKLKSSEFKRRSHTLVLILSY